MVDAPSPVERVDAMLQAILQLTQTVIDHKHDWSAGPEDVELMYRAASLMGRSLAPETFTSASAALAFLLMARFSLETTAAAIRGG